MRWDNIARYTALWVQLAGLGLDGSPDANRIEYVALRCIGKISVEQDEDGDYVIFFWADNVRHLLLSCHDHDRAQNEVTQLMRRSKWPW
jgi:hypothetical protein